MRIGVLYMGNDSTRIWGSAITTYYLSQAFAELGHQTWRAPVTETADWTTLLEQPTELVIAEGVPAYKIPESVWQRCRYIVHWWLSELFYHEEAVAQTSFHGIATNAEQATVRLRAKGVIARTIELAAPVSFASTMPKPEYRDVCTYLGSYPHKSPEQLELILRPATEFGLSIWGAGWERSAFQPWHRGVLPLLDIGALYRNVQVVLALTEEKQKLKGMMNNRIFEALAAGAIVVSDPHLTLSQHELGAFVHFASSAAQVRDVLDMARHDDSLRRLAQEGQRLVLARHTYRDRALDFLALYEELR